MSADVNSGPIAPPTNSVLISDIFFKAAEASIICYLTRKLSYKAGLAYGGLAGMIQLLFSGIHLKINNEPSWHSLKQLNYMLSAYMPWAISAIALHQIFKKTGNDNLLITSRIGLSIAIMQQIMCRSTIHLLPKD